jgi:SAM-dependent methyltransferase
VGAYGPELASIHDSGYTDPALLGARRLVAELERSEIDSGVVVDIGCGSGTSSAVLSDAGFDVLGIDPSPAMLELARERAPGALFKEGTAATAPLPRCVAVAALGEPLNYVTTEDSDDADAELGAVFSRVHEALVPGGLFAFDLAGPDRGTPRQAVRSWEEDEGWAVLVENVQTGRLLRRRIIAFRNGPGGWSRTEEHHLQRLHPAAEVLDRLRDAGFRARSVVGWDGTRARPGHTAFIARRAER